jgi:preprotein translocase subunit SecD
VSMFTAVVLTRSLLIWLVNTKIIKNPKLFGA